MWFQTFNFSMLILLLATGCAGTAQKLEIQRLKKKVELLTQRQRDRDRDVDSITNRLFLLEDKVDTTRVAAQRKAPVRLPVVRIRPEDTQHPSPRLSDDPRVRSGGKSLVAQESVEFSGAARGTARGPRPVLRLHGMAPNPAGRTPGSVSPPASASVRPQRGLDPESVKEKLKVVPMPKRKTAIAMAKAPPSGPMRDYTHALGLLRQGRQHAAAKAFSRFVKRNAKHAYADNGLYWLGECHYDLKNFREALKMFRRVVEKYPGGNKAPAALLKMGFSYIKLNEKQNARTVLAQVVDIFPRTHVARLASKTLSKLR